MKSKIFMMFTVVAAVSALTIAATAQTSAARMLELKRGIPEQIKTNADRHIAEPLLPEADELLSDESADKYAKKNALAGTWDVVLTFGDGSQVNSTLQIMPGASEGEGSAIHASMYSLAAPNPTLPEQGSWRHVSGNRFVTSYYGYSFDTEFQPFGKIGFKHSITIRNDQTRFTGVAVFEVIDMDGKVLFSDNCTTTGVRQRAVAP